MPSEGGDGPGEGARPPWAIVVSVEHGGNDVPKAYAERFTGFESLLKSHRGWDPGSLELGRDLALRLDATLVAATVSRLLVDLNRSPHHRHVCSEVTRPLPRADKEMLMERYHRPHRDSVMGAVSRAVARGQRVLHLGVHSFVPVLDGVARKPDIALLYDPKRPAEAQIARAWCRELSALEPARAVRRNDPYRGSADGLTTTIRTLHPDPEYCGLEIEVNQKHLEDDGGFPPWICDALSESLVRALDGVWIEARWPREQPP